MTLFISYEGFITGSLIFLYSIEKWNDLYKIKSRIYNFNLI